MIAERVAATNPAHYRNLGGLGAWSYTAPDGRVFTDAILQVPQLTLSNYRQIYPDWVGDPPSQADLDSIMQQMREYRLCWWHQLCSLYGTDPLQPLEQGTPDWSQVATGEPGGGVTVIEGPFLIDDPYTLPAPGDVPGGPGPPEYTGSGGGGAAAGGGSAGGGPFSHVQGSGAGSAPGTGEGAAAGDGEGFGLSSEVFGIPVWMLAAGGGLALWAMSANKKGYR